MSKFFKCALEEGAEKSTTRDISTVYWRPDAAHNLALEQIEYSYSFPMRDEWRDIYPAGADKVVEYVFVAVVNG